MTRFPCLALGAGVTVLGAASVATADFVTQPVRFKSDFSGFYPGGPAENWAIEHDLDVTYDDVTGSFATGIFQNIEATFVVGGEQIAVTTEIEYTAGVKDYFGMRYVIPDAPFGYGPMEIDIYGFISTGFGRGRWFGELQASVSSGSGFFGEGETYDVDFFAEVIPAPGAIALFGFVGLSTRRRRD